MLNTLLSIAKRRSLTWMSLSVAGTLAACASAPPTTATGPMNLGSAATPPAGYLDFCARRPDQCGIDGARDASGQPISTAELTRDLYKQYYWSVAFHSGDASAQSQVAAAPAPLAVATLAAAETDDVTPAAPAPAVLLGSSDWRSRSDAVRIALTPASDPFNISQPMVTQPAVYTGPAASIWMRANAPAGDPALASIPANPPQAAAAAEAPPAPVGPAAVPVTPELMSMLDQVNRRINGAIAYAHDWQVYGQHDYWALPLDPGGPGRGDCKDYVLEKHRALIEQGVPAQALSIAIVRIPTGEKHAVLLVATDRGELVLDSLSSWVLPWTQVHYEWLERQAPGQQLSWVTISNNGRL